LKRNPVSGEAQQQLNCIIHGSKGRQKNKQNKAQCRVQVCSFFLISEPRCPRCDFVLLCGAFELLALPMSGSALKRSNQKAKTEIEIEKKSDIGFGFVLGRGSQFLCVRGAVFSK
jgi:hypothetical protein